MTNSNPSITTPMEQICIDLQLRAAEAAPAEPQWKPADRLHLASCSECREFLLNAAETGGLLVSLGTSARSMKLESDKAAALKMKVLRESRHNLARWRAAEQERAREVGPISSFRELLFGWIRPETLFWTAAAAVLLITLSTAGWWWQQSRPIGQATFAEGTLKIEQAAFSGFGGRTLDRGTHLATGNGGAVVDLGGGEQVRLALARQTRLKLTDARVIQLDEGSIWLNVNPNGRGLRVRTPQGEVIVTGTVFGVSAGRQKTMVEVTRGQVKVCSAGGEQPVNAGQQTAADAAGVQQAFARADGTDVPAWVDELSRAERAARAASYIPSLGTKRSGY